MASTKIKKNDLVVILSGKDKGKTGAVLETNYKKQTVIVKDVNKKTKHHKPSQENQEGKIEKKEFPIHISNVGYMVKIGWKTDAKSGQKQRYLRKTKKVLGGK